MILVGAYAFVRGAGPERAAAATILGMELTDRLNHAIFGPKIELLSIDIAHAVIDLGTFVAFLWIALRANRVYPLWLAGFQLIALSAHAAREVALDISQIGYYIMFVGPSYFQIMTVAIGTWTHHRRVLRYGAYRSWT